MPTAPAPHPALAGGSLPVFETARLRLRRLEERDLDALLTIFGDPQVARYTSRPPMPDLAAVRIFLDYIHANAAHHDGWTWGVCRRDDDALLGTVALFALEMEQGRAEVGYVLGRAAWGHGYATEAMGALVDFCFGPLGLRRLEADADPRNTPSLRVLERLGFTREGLLRERWKVAGEIQDSAIYGLLSREWVRSGCGATPG